LVDRDEDNQIDFPESALIIIPSAPEHKSKLKKKYNNEAVVKQYSNHMIQLMMEQLMQKTHCWSKELWCLSY